MSRCEASNEAIEAAFLPGDEREALSLDLPSPDALKSADSGCGRHGLAALRTANWQLRDANQRLVRSVAEAQQRRDEAEQIAQRQAAFLVLLAHELRAPLSPIRTAAALLGMARAGDVRPYVQAVIERQVGYITRLVEDLLDTVRARTGKLSLQCHRLDICSVMKAALATCSADIAARMQVVEFAEAEVPVMVDGDPVRLQQVFNNLIVNASKYTPRGGRVTIAIRIDVDEQTVAVVVADTGIGITQAALARVFDRYVQEPHALRYDASGFGLGLPLVRELVQAHGGRVAASSGGLGCGSRFEVTLHLAKAGSQTRASPGPSAAE